ncbi:LysR family transcriptional regulator [Candidimonas humi]|jgi:DNA-binding transcriptional LysR family regulator|uniref:LysR family transcriptional regulator n=1 Tax=Candidimonas humi TaxID=683355 RepID=A0ABV8NWV0_9BURK|nr:LysR family transcriptional regulator [Candidimonas humi]MBV6304066.1 LysR family transcriptional regulator [Candidimonas humi]
MELRHLRYFMAVAKELHFTRAAELLGIGQPPLSQQIQQLEREVGAPLFMRDRRGVSLTEAGKAFMAEAQLALDGAERATEAARRVARGEVGTLTLGFTVSANLHPFVPSLIRLYRSRYPGVAVRLVEQTTLQLIERVHNGTVDLAFVRAPTQPTPGVHVEAILSEPMVAVVPSTHALAGRPSIRLRELAREPFIFYPRQVGVGLYNVLVGACRRAGFTLSVDVEAPQLTSVVTFVAAGMGVSVVPATMSQLQVEGVRYLPLQGRPLAAGLAMAYREGPASEALAFAVDLTRETAVVDYPPGRSE